MTKDEFRRLLNAGHGRAALYARDNDISQWRDVIEDMCVHCRAVDVTFDGTHAAYIYNVVERLPDAATYRDAILAALPETGDNFDTWHRLTLACFLAADGNPDAREAVYAHFKPGPKFGEKLAVQLVRLDGMPAFLCAAENIGALLQNPENEVDQGLLFFVACKKCGEEEVLTALRAAAPGNPNFAAYLAAATTPPRSSRSARYDRIRWGREATRETLLEVAQELASTHNPELLSVFVDRAYPLDPAPLFALSNHRDAVHALTEITHPPLREFAIQLVESQSPNRDLAIDILLNNAQPDDVQLALSWYLAEPDPQVRHTQEPALRKTGSIPLLKAVYENSHCSECRLYAVEDLLEQNAFPDAWREECQYDASDELADLLQTYNGKS